MNRPPSGNPLSEFLLRGDAMLRRQVLAVLLVSLGLLAGLFWLLILRDESQGEISNECDHMSASAQLGASNKQLTGTGEKFLVAQVTASEGITRNAPDDEAPRLTPLPKGTRAIIKERKKDWLRLDYGAWINQQEAQVLSTTIAPRSLICNVVFRQVPGKTEVVFPLQAPVPVTIQQGQGWFGLILHHTVASHSLTPPQDDPVISNMSFQQVKNDRVQYGFNFRDPQQWGYDLRYEGSNLILSLRKSPFADQEGFFASAMKSGLPLSGISIVIDPGHGGLDSGAKIPSGYQEKDLALTVSKILRQELELRGATVYLTREEDVDMSLDERVAVIDRIKPAIALSVHYNHVPENVNGSNIRGVSTYWYHPQSRSLAELLQKQMLDKLERKSFGVKWKNLALARPTIAPSVLLELGFMSNPSELEWIINPANQTKVAQTLADGLVQWFENSK